MKLKWRLIIAMIFVALSVARPPEVFGAEAAKPPARPKLGLALGGGSARGFVHIGFLRWLEENRIPVDYLTGTSMGGLIGGLYAMGMSPEQIMDLVTRINWDQMFDSTPPFNALTFRRKEDRLDYPAELEIGVRDKMMIPDGLAVYRIDLLLSRLTLPYSALESFEQLPVPFRCVATDIRNSESVILTKGSLAGALRATMSLPGVFVPIEHEGRLLVDGGLVNNVPADVVKQMGADVVVAVNCNDGNANKDLRGMDAVLINSLNAVIVENTKRALKTADIVVAPEMEGLSATDWAAAPRFIALGYQAAAANGAALKKYAVDALAWRQYLQQRTARRREQALIPEAIEVRGANPLNRVKIQEELAGLAGHEVDPGKLEAALIKLLGTDLYDSFRYDIIRREQRPVLLITVQEKPYGPPFIRFVPEINFLEERAEVNLHSRITGYHLWGPDSELRADLALGTDPLLKAELYKPLSREGWFIAPQLRVERVNHSLFRNGARQADYVTTDWMAGFDLGYNLDQSSEVRVGYQLGRQKVATQLGESLESENGTVSKAGLQWSYIKIDTQSMQAGFYCEAKADWYAEAPGAEGSFGMADTSLTWVTPLTQRKSLIALLGAGVTRGHAPLMQQFKLGGPFELGIYAADELHGDNYLLGSVGMLHYAGQSFGLGPLYFCALVENGGVFEHWSDLNCKSNLSVGFIGEMPLGKYYLGSSLDVKGTCRVSVLIGRVF